MKLLAIPLFELYDNAARYVFYVLSIYLSLPLFNSYSLVLPHFELLHPINPTYGLSFLIDTAPNYLRSHIYSRDTTSFTNRQSLASYSQRMSIWDIQSP